MEKSPQVWITKRYSLLYCSYPDWYLRYPTVGWWLWFLQANSNWDSSFKHKSDISCAHSLQKSLAFANSHLSTIGCFIHFLLSPPISSPPFISLATQNLPGVRGDPAATLNAYISFMAFVTLSASYFLISAFCLPGNSKHTWGRQGGRGGEEGGRVSLLPLWTHISYVLHVFCNIVSGNLVEIKPAPNYV